MPLCEVHWSSSILEKKVGMYVILPEPALGEGPWPVYYLLHGLSDDYTVWQRRTRIEWYVRDMPMIVVMPDGFRGFYTNNADGPKYATFMTTELIDFVERYFPARRDRAGRCVGGLSMGGYGALRLALDGFGNPYASANSHSGALMHGSRNSPREDGPLTEKEFRRIFGDRPAGSDHDLLWLARFAAAAAAKGNYTPKLLLDCGTEDHLLDDNRTFHRELTRIGVPHEYREFPGGHDWDYWDAHVRDALAFHMGVMGVRKGAKG
jgi:S-formylglutathione hydrolase FrmB